MAIILPGRSQICVRSVLTKGSKSKIGVVQEEKYNLWIPQVEHALIAQKEEH